MKKIFYTSKEGMLSYLLSLILAIAVLLYIIVYIALVIYLKTKSVKQFESIMV